MEADGVVIIHHGVRLSSHRPLRRAGVFIEVRNDVNKFVSIAALARAAFGDTAEICIYGPGIGAPDQPAGVQNDMAIVCKLRERLPALDERRRLFASVASHALGGPVRIALFTGD